jgi:hypothetical protein
MRVCVVVVLLLLLLLLLLRHFYNFVIVFFQIQINIIILKDLRYDDNVKRIVSKTLGTKSNKYKYMVIRKKLLDIIYISY